MRHTTQLQKAALSDLFKRITLSTKSPLSNTSPAKTSSSTKQADPSVPGKWERSFDRLTESLYGPLPMTEVEARNLAGSLNSYLITNLEKRSQKVNGPVSDHFMDLFTNLNNINGGHDSHFQTVSNSQYQKPTDIPATKSILAIPFTQRVSLLSKCKSNADLESYFQELYFSGKLNKHLLITILKNKNFISLDLVSRFIFSGVRTHSLSVPTLHYARMIIANRNWALGNKDAAKKMVIDSWDNVWNPALKSNTLQPNVIQGLVKALIAFNRLDLLKNTLEDWRTELQSFSNQENLVDTLQNIPSSILPVFSTLLQTKQYHIARLAAEIGVVYYSILVTKRQNSVSEDLSRVRTLSFIYFKCLFSIASLPSHILDSQAVTKPISTLIESIQKMEALYSSSSELDESFDIKDLSDGLGNATVIFADIAASTLSNLSESASLLNFELDKQVISTQLENLVSLIKPVLKDKMSHSQNSATVGPRESVTLAVALQKVKSVEKYLNQDKNDRNGGDSSSNRHEYEQVSDHLVWN